MRLHHRHEWDVDAGQAVAIQKALRTHVVQKDELNGKIRFVAGVDVGFEDEGRTARAAVAVLGFPELQPVTQAIARVPVRFPYIPGLLSFREIPAIVQALEKLEHLPELLLCDGQGYAHPRRFGLACHLGVLTGIPSIGVGKTRLLGRCDALPDRRGAWVPLMDKDEIIGAVLRTREGVKPLFISIGHRISLNTAIDYVMRCTTRYKLPQTTRYAHRLASG
jgi:deoxyribonuclease V